MTENQIILFAAQLQKIARYEITFEDVIKDAPSSEGEITCADVYRFTLEDLYCALKAMKASDPTVNYFRENWYYPITLVADAFDLDSACGAGEENDDLPETTKKYPGLNLLDSDYFSIIWEQLGTACRVDDDEMPLSEAFSFDETLADLDRYFGNKGNPIEEWIFSDVEMRDYISFFRDDDYVKQADEKQLALARKCIAALCAKDCTIALHIKGYSYYGGNRLYPCDWNISRACMIRLFEKEDDPQYANTLGYIYYYGRCNEGIPDYDKAFYYFGIAAANGLYEGMYKLGDMFCHGYGCKASQRTALSLYSMVYEDSIKNFLRGEHASFADAAFRMGSVYRYGIGVKPNAAYAYYYYLQAEYAAGLRAEEDDFFGNKTVVKNARKALAETEALLPEDFFQDSASYVYPTLFEGLSSGNNKCLLTKTLDEAGQPELIAERLATQSVPKPEAILVTIPQVKHCKRTLKVSYIPNVKVKIWMKEDAAQVRYDFCRWNEDEKRYEFYYDEELVALLETGDGPLSPRSS